MTKILIIEDEEALLAMLANKLEREGYTTITATDGEEGLARIKQERPDLVLLDILMPKMGGMEVLEAMHRDRELSKIPVIIISNSGQDVEIEKAKILGARDYLIKAEFDPKEVVEKVTNILGTMKNVKKDKNDAAKRSKNAQRSVSTSITNKNKDDTFRMEKTDGPKILVIEDDQFLRDLIVKKLEDEGFETVQAIDGEDGLRLAREEKPDLILLDLILPGIDGFEVLKELKSNSELSKIFVIILSNLGQKDDIDRGIKLGAKDYLIKAHFTPGEIVNKVKEIIE